MYKLANIVTGSVVASLVLTIAVVFTAATGDCGAAMNVVDMTDGERPWTATRMVDGRGASAPLTDTVVEIVASPLVGEGTKSLLAE